MNPTFSSYRPLAPLPERRRAVLIGVFGFAVLLLSQFVNSAEVSRPVSVMVSLTGLLLMVYGWSKLLFPGLLGLPHMNQSGLDERQQAVVTRSYATAYGILSGGLLLFYAYMLLADMFAGLPRITADADSSLMLVGLIWLVLGLPAAVMAWTEPDPAD